MKEIAFIRNNLSKWQKAEITIDDADDQLPDALADVYIDLTDDLAFAQAHYPYSRITVYLNKICSTLHRKIYKNKKEKWSRLITFWTDEVPLAMYNSRKLFLLSFIIFLASVLIGSFSQMCNSEFSRLILGNDYTNMTLDNIAKGKPVDVFNNSKETGMFLGITVNNIMVSFIMFTSGIFTSVSTGFYLFKNCIQLGCLETLFYQHGYLNVSLITILQHGTLELSAIMISAAAGMSLGNGWLFPGTYSRLVSFRKGAKRGLKIVVGTVPVFICAGFIEGFISRHTELPSIWRILIILLSLMFIITYFVLLPIKKHKNLRK